MPTRKRINRLVSFLTSILIILILLVTSIDLVTFHRGFYISQYDRLNSSQMIGIERDDLLRVTWELLDYIRGEREEMNSIVAKIGNENRNVFNEKEIAHMEDVRDLFLMAYSLRDMSILLLFLLFVLLYFNSYKQPWSLMAKSFLLTAMLALLLGGLLILLIKSDFTRYWDQFHFIFFDNNLWQLDPSTDILIQMVPESFFFSAVSRVLLYFITGIIAFAVTSFTILYRAKRLQKRTGLHK